jgi:hypothetical protein
MGFEVAVAALELDQHVEVERVRALVHPERDAHAGVPARHHPHVLDSEHAAGAEPVGHAAPRHGAHGSAAHVEVGGLAGEQPAGGSSVMTTVTGWPEQAALLAHLTWTDALS